MNGFGTLGDRLWNLMRTKPKTSAAIGLAFAALALGVWSCQTMPQRTARSLEPAKGSVEPEVRIRIRNGVQAAKLEGAKTFLLKRAREELRVEGPLTLSIAPDGLRALDGKGERLPVSGWGTFEVAAVGDTAKETAPGVVPRVRIDTSLYPGRIRIYARPGGSLADESSRTDARLDLVALTTIEDYLVGVVAAELYPDWKAPGVFEVQAVCARTYALQERQRSIDLRQEWDLEATEEDQAYKGGSFKAEAYKAVRDTRGLVLTWNGKLIRAYYSSTCGGRTAAAADVWPTGPGYEFNLAAPIQAHPREAICQASPRYRWEVTRDKALFSKQLREWGKAKGQNLSGLGLFKSLTVDKTNVNGRPSRYIVTDGAGKTYPISAEMLRTACNFKTAGVPALTKDTLVRSGDIEMTVQGQNVVIRGRGFGHGVGMCQFCAKAMAERGDSWRDMVLRFYPGAKIERAY